MAADAIVRRLMDDFRRIVQALRTSHRAAGNLELTGAQLFVLKVLGENGRPMSINELAEATETTQSTVSAVTSRLIDRGLIASARSAEDARRAEVSLTPRGRTLHRKAPATVAQIRLAGALNDLGDDDARVLASLLERIVSAMGIGAEPAPMMFDEEKPSEGGTARNPK
jgi:DNA-binding MarR family transcriptional regulator